MGVPSEWCEPQLIDPHKPVVILISGFGGNARSLAVMRKRLLRDGFNVLIVSLSWDVIADSVAGLSWLAKKLSALVLELRKRKGMQRQKIFLVAHSAGGLVARHYIQLLGGDHYCDGLVTLATPHLGTWVAALGFFTHLILKARCLYQLLPISMYIDKVNHSDFPKGFPMASIYSPDDALCPESSTVLPPSVSESKNVEVHRLARVSHVEFLMSKKVYTHLKKWFGQQGVTFRSAHSKAC